MSNGHDIYYNATTYLEFGQTARFVGKDDHGGGFFWKLHHDGAVTESGATFKTKQGAFDDFREVIVSGVNVLNSMPKAVT